MKAKGEACLVLLLLGLLLSGGLWTALPARVEGLAQGLRTPDSAGAAPLSTLGPQRVERAFPNLSFTRAVHLTHAGDGTNRLWAVLQPGRIMVFPNDPAVATASLFLDIQDRVNDEGDEEGLLGLAFDPSYSTNGYFYVYYSAANPRRSVISRFSVSAANPNQAGPASELVLLEVAQPFPNHNGGTILFGGDGYLYVALGDGGGGGDPFGHGQDVATLLGSILRIDVRDATAQQPYGIPADNPLVGVGGGARGEIWAYGLRNPWKVSWDPETGELWAGDVGQADYEEVDFIRPGRNYGWDIMEGVHCYPSSIQSCNQAGLEPPVVEYDHTLGCSITGGYVYRGNRLPNLAGAYIYADYCSGRIWGLRYSGSALTDDALLVDTELAIPSFGVDEQGELYILTFQGPIYRFVGAALPATPTPILTPVPTPTLTPTPTPTPTSTQVPGWPVWSLAVLAVLLLFVALRARRRRRPA